METPVEGAPNVPFNQNDCLLCGCSGELAYPERFDRARVNEFSYSSRKEPELMHFEYLRCERCRILFSSNRQSPDELEKEYVNADFDAETESAYAAKTYWRLARPWLSKDDMLLDVGCGDGAFIAECGRNGICARGVEPSPRAAERASQEVLGRIFVGPYQKFSQEGTIDALTLFQTIEHLDDPVAFLRWTHDQLSPGGRLMIACHDHLAPLNRLLRERSPIFDIEHLQLLSRPGLVQLMETAGFKVEFVTRYSNTYPLSYWARLAPVPRVVRKVLSMDRIGTRPIRLPVGNVFGVGRRE